jgi:hypothetical protein
MDVPFCWQAVELRGLNYEIFVTGRPLTSDGDANADAIPSDADDASAGASPNDGGANPNACDANDGDRASDVPSALLPA